MGFHRHLPAPTVAERDRWARIKESGCIACIRRGIHGVYPEIHHQTITGRHGGKAKGHRYSVGLCAWHHRGVYLVPDRAVQLRVYGPSFAATPKQFRAEFGEDDELLRLQDEEINEPPVDAEES